MTPKRHEHLPHHHLGNTKTSTYLQQDIKMLPLPPRKTSYYHLPITKHSSQKKKKKKFYPNADIRTKISHISTYIHNPSLLLIPPLLQ